MRKNLVMARGKPAGSFRTQPIPVNTVTGDHKAAQTEPDSDEDGRTWSVCQKNKLRQAEAAHWSTVLV